MENVLFHGRLKIKPIKFYLSCLILCGTLFFLIGYGTTGSLNPLTFYFANSLSVKIMLVILIFLMFISLWASISIRKILISTKEEPTSAICLWCENEVWHHFLRLGGAVQCQYCGQWYHRSHFRGNNCKRAMENTHPIDLNASNIFKW